MNINICMELITDTRHNVMTYPPEEIAETIRFIEKYKPDSNRVEIWLDALKTCYANRMNNMDREPKKKQTRKHR